MKKRILSLLAASAALTLIGTPCLQAAESASEGVPFSAFSYEPFDTQQILSLIDEARTLSFDKANKTTILKLLNQIADLQVQQDENYVLCSIYADQNVNDEYFSDELIRALNAYYEIDDAISLLYRDLLNSPCKAAIRMSLGKENADYYQAYEELTGEDLSLATREQEISEQYAVLMTGEHWADAGELFLELLDIRKQIAANAGYDNYADYAYEVSYWRDYTPEQAAALWEDVKTCFTEIYQDVNDYLYSSDQEGLYAAIAGKSAKELFEMAEPYFAKIDASLEEDYRFMIENELYDMDYSENKNPTGYTTWFPYTQEAFIFNQPIDDYYDFSTVLHEFGHFHAYMQNVDTAYNSDLDLTEVHSQGLVLLFTQYFADIFSEDLRSAAVAYEISNILGSIIEGCLYDEFQQRAFAMEDPTVEKLCDLYVEINSDYDIEISDARREDWITVNHNFDYPFYYISYAASAFPALELWIMAQEDPQSAIDTYNELVACGWYDYFGSTLTDCGLDNPFSEGYAADLAERLSAEIYE